MQSTTENTKKLSEAMPNHLANILEGREKPPVVDWASYNAQVRKNARLDSYRRLLEQLEATHPHWRDFNIDHPSLVDTRSQCQAVLDWQPSPQGLTLTGYHGGGKSRVTFTLARRLISQDQLRVAWWAAQELAGRISEEIDYGADDARRFIAALAGVPILIIDDLGQEDVTPSQKPRVDAWLLQLIDQRANHGKPLIITTNRTAKGFHAKYGYDRGAAIARRLADHSQILKFKPC